MRTSANGLLEVLQTAAMFEEWGFGRDQAVALAKLAFKVRHNLGMFR